MSRSGSLDRVCTGIAILLLGACTGADLTRVERPAAVRDDDLEISGELCTRDPDTRLSPVRVLFVVDTSESMRVTDPPDPISGETGRERAVRETWERLLAGGPEGIRVGIVRFSAESQSLTPVDVDGDSIPDTYFTADTTQLAAATLALRETSRTTNYSAALAEAYFEVRTELLAAEQTSLPRTRFVIVFVSDGVPDTDGASARDSSRQAIFEAVTELVELGQAFRVGDLGFHTAFIATDPGSAADRDAETLLQAMASRASGTFRSFPGGEAIDFVDVDFTVIRRLYTLRAITVENVSALLHYEQSASLAGYVAPPVPIPASEDAGTTDTDTDTGGVADEAVREPPLELHWTATDRGDPREFVDLDHDGYPSCGEPLVDSDGDGLADLVESLFQTDPLIADTDDDGLRDRVEWALSESGLDPLDPSDGGCFVADPCVDADLDMYCDCIADADADGVCDCAEVASGICEDAAGHDCLDSDLDGLCDCPDRNADGLCDYEDRDGDRLHDCEEIFFGTSRNGPDTDSDGFPDVVEIRTDSSAVESDRETDLDWDRTPNGTEVPGFNDPWCDDSALRAQTAYAYDLDELGMVGATQCYRFSVGHVTLVPTLPSLEGGYPGNGWNRVYVWAGEAAFDDPDSFADWRVACVMARYEPNGDLRAPASGRVQLTDDSFIPLEDFDADRDCIWP